MDRLTDKAMVAQLATGKPASEEIHRVLVEVALDHDMTMRRSVETYGDAAFDLTEWAKRQHVLDFLKDTYGKRIKEGARG